jgi:hypothetical protein
VPLASPSGSTSTSRRIIRASRRTRTTRAASSSSSPVRRSRPAAATRRPRTVRAGAIDRQCAALGRCGRCSRPAIFARLVRLGTRATRRGAFETSEAECSCDPDLSTSTTSCGPADIPLLDELACSAWSPAMTRSPGDAHVQAHRRRRGQTSRRWPCGC